MSSLSAAALALLEQVRPTPVGRAQQMFKAFVGLAVIIVLPAVMVWWARKKYRP